MAVITLLSDFGLQDASAAIARGILLQHNPGALITDISHEAKPFDTAHAAYLLACAWQQFPVGTCHVVLCDLFPEKPARIIAATREGHYFLSADNGIVAAGIGVGIDAWNCSETGTETDYDFATWLHTAARTVRNLDSKDMAESDMPGYKLKTHIKNATLPETNTVQCEVLHVDHYQNVVLNITQSQFEGLRQSRSFRLQFSQVEEISEMSTAYSDVRPGTKLCRFNSNGYLEICVNRGNAAGLFGLRPGGKKNDVKIIFE